jgi:hypothetical protein
LVGTSYTYSLASQTAEIPRDIFRGKIHRIEDFEEPFEEF